MPFDKGPKQSGGGGPSEQNADLATVFFFLRDAGEDGAWYAGYSGDEAFDAFARLIGRDPDELRG